MNKVKYCILFSAENRWFDSWNLWIQTGQNYFNPDSFRLCLNNCIQSLRQVTWILQKNKSSIPNFEEWYAKWQTKMERDPILKWLKEARNTIVKEGDLLIHSKARIAIVESWFDPPTFEIEIPPNSKTDGFVKILTKHIPKNKSFLIGLLRAERRWVDSKLPNNELLDALAYVFQFLSNIILDAHESLLKPEDVKQCSWYYAYNSSKEQIQRSMSSINLNRMLWIDLKNNEIIDVKEIPLKKNKERNKYVKKRYSDNIEFAKKLKGIKGFTKETEGLFELAKNILIKDGHHNPIAYIGYPNGKKRLYGMEFRDRGEKYLVTYELANIIKKTGATSLILINEAWVAPISNVELTQKGIKSQERKEALMLNAIDAEGNEHHYGVIFKKERGKIFFKKNKIDFNKQNINFLIPIRAIWKNGK